MAELFGRSGAALRERVGTLSQVVRVDQFVEDNGSARGARRIRMVNGGGLEVEVHPDRALDIGRVTFDGVPLSWISPTDIGSPHEYEASGTGWLRTFGGGLLATCGLDTFGPPGLDGGDDLGMHGRIGARPSHVLHAEATADRVIVTGVVRQASVFGENLVLRRTISSETGSTEVRVDDVVTNEGFDDSPHMILYHCNLGWPLLGDAARLEVESATEVVPRDEAAQVGMNSWSEVGAPVEGWSEQVFRHDLVAEPGQVLRVANPELGVTFEVVVDGADLPYVYQWKMIAQGHYVLGIEPSNCAIVQGRAAARESGDLPFLRPGQSAAYAIVFRAKRRNGATS